MIDGGEPSTPATIRGNAPVCDSDISASSGDKAVVLRYSAYSFKHPAPGAGRLSAIAPRAKGPLATG
jgi:hypothetical protein